MARPKSRLSLDDHPYLRHSFHWQVKGLDGQGQSRTLEGKAKTETDAKERAASVKESLRNATVLVRPKYAWEIDRKRKDGTRYRDTGEYFNLVEAISARLESLKKFEQGSAAGVKLTVKAWGTYCVERIWPDEDRPRTLQNKRSNLDKWVYPLLGDLYLDMVTEEHIDSVLVAMKKQGLSDHTRANLRNTISDLFTTAQRRHKVPAGFNPTKAISINRRKKSRDSEGRKVEQVRSLTAEEQSRLLEWSQSHWAYGAILLALKMGLRTGEILGAEWSSIDWKQRLFHVRQQAQRIPGKGMQITDCKTDDSERTIPIPEPVYLWLKEERERNSHRWILANTNGDLVSPENLHDAVNDLVFIAGLTNNVGDHGEALPKPTMHDLRRTWCSTMANVHGVKIQTLAALSGHSIQVCLEYYVKTNLEDMRAAMAHIS